MPWAGVHEDAGSSLHESLPWPPRSTRRRRAVTCTGGVAWTALGCLIAVLSWQMDRMTQQGATLHTAPGLWPGIVGTLLAALGGVLVLRSWRRAQHDRLGCRRD